MCKKLVKHYLFCDFSNTVVSPCNAIEWAEKFSHYLETFTDLVLNREQTQRFCDQKSQEIFAIFREFYRFCVNKETLYGESTVFLNVGKKYLLT
jgi:hypothetical protein